MVGPNTGPTIYYLMFALNIFTLNTEQLRKIKNLS